MPKKRSGNSSDSKTLWSIILKYSEGKNETAVKNILKKAFIAHHPNEDPQVLRDRIDNWARSSDRTVDKNTALELCSFLHLSKEQEACFFAEITGENLHLSDQYDKKASSTPNERFGDYLRDMTTISRHMFEQSINSNITLNDAVSMLRKNAIVRTLWDSIMKYSGETNDNVVKRQLIDALHSHDPNSNPDTIRHRVGDWFSNAVHTINRKTALELCFALNLTIEQADCFLAEITEEGLHWRDPYELLCIFGLQHKMNYPQVCKLYERIADIPFDTADESSASVPSDSMTLVIRNEFFHITSIDELISYIRQERKRLGTLHNTAHYMFEQMMDCLITPDKMSEEEAEALRISRKQRGISSDNALDPVMKYDKERKMTVQEVLYLYLYRNSVPANAGRAQHAVIERMISKNWPSASDLSQMKNRVIDINRKTLMLLFLATGGGDNCTDDLADDDLFYDDDYGYEDEEIESEQAEFESNLVRLNAMLSDCGMRRLDPRLPFDWMILYCLCSSDILTLDSQIQEFLDTLFRDPTDPDDSGDKK